MLLMVLLSFEDAYTITQYFLYFVSGENVLYMFGYE